MRDVGRASDAKYSSRPFSASHTHFRCEMQARFAEMNDDTVQALQQYAIKQRLVLYKNEKPFRVEAESGSNGVLSCRVYYGSRNGGLAGNQI